MSVFCVHPSTPPPTMEPNKGRQPAGHLTCVRHGTYLRGEPVLETAELITSRLTGAGSLLPPVYGEAWAKGHATGTPDSTFPGTGRRTRQTCGSRNATPTEITDDEDMITYDVEEEELEQDPFILPEVNQSTLSTICSLENYNDRRHPVVCKILDITSRLYSKGFDIVFCWLPSHVGIIGNEQANSAAKSATTHLPLAVPLSDMKRVIMHHIFKIWQESWSQQLHNKLHSVKPVIGAWPVMPMRRTDVKLTRLRIGHTRLTHRHLLFGEHAPECPSCHVSYTVHHILIDCPIFNNYRITFFNSSHLTLPDLVGEIPHQNIFAF
ncbi:RNase H domain-containing protein [Trichonephila clavipes]|nr:RNase H domain-containing protein [Trichonephila clavipes]